jgi:hypothetical protein
VEALGHHDRLLHTEDPLRPHTRVVGVETGVVQHDLVVRHLVLDQPAAHRLRLVVVEVHVVAGHQDHPDPARHQQPPGDLQPGREERRRRTARVDLRTQHQGHRSGRHVVLGVDVVRGFGPDPPHTADDGGRGEQGADDTGEHEPPEPPPEDRSGSPGGQAVRQC